jgi:hypothetical protein
LWAVPCVPHTGRGLFGFYVRQERGDDERGEELDVVFQVSCVLYILSKEGYQRELVSDSWMGAKDIRWSSFEMGSEMRELPHTLAFDQTMPQCLRNMFSSLAAKKLDVHLC